MKTYILLANPDNDSFNGKIAETYHKKALEAGHEVRIQKLGEMKFDPVLWKGYKEIQELEPDLLEAQDNINWCEKWVIIYPVWWGSVPAIMKGYMDRVLHPGFAFKFHEKDQWWDKLLKGKSAELISTSDAPGFWLSFKYKNSDLRTLKSATLEYCGIKPVKVKRIDRLKSRKKEDKEKILNKIGESIS